MTSQSFELLDSRIQRWMWDNQWTQLRYVQEQAIPPIVLGTNDVLISASTAAGKTEAAFLPALTHILKPENKDSLILYVSPLKALINDQFTRIDRLCEGLDLNVVPWHGDIPQSTKNKFYRSPSGVLSITPESLESLFINHHTKIRSAFAKIKFIIVDELHSFIGTERGKQLQSLMHRVERLIERRIPRIGLSATIGDMRIGAHFLRQRDAESVVLIHSAANDTEIRMQLKTSVTAPPPKEDRPPLEPIDRQPTLNIALHIFKHARGTKNLVFPGQRAAVESYTVDLRELSEAAGVPNEFWPHHGNLSKAEREDAEAALKDKSKPCTVICTSTLELGIDIGDIDTVFHIESPPSVASLKQRLGRSGRREGSSAVLRAYSIATTIDARSNLPTRLHLKLFEFTAMILLLLENWFEPPKLCGLHLSTFVQQLLSLIAQHGGISPKQAFQELIEHGAFDNVDRESFKVLLKHLNSIHLIQQDSSGLLLLGSEGELQVNHYSFYATFDKPEEVRLYAGNQLLGTAPAESIAFVDQIIIFAGRRWQVQSLDQQSKVAQLIPCAGGTTVKFQPMNGRDIHTRVRQMMKQLYEDTKCPTFLDGPSQRIVAEGRENYAFYQLATHPIIEDNGEIYLFTWLGDDINLSLSALLARKGLIATHYGCFITITPKASEGMESVYSILRELHAEPHHDAISLITDPELVKREKWDWTLPDDLLKKSFASRQLDIEAAYRWIAELLHAPAQ